MIRVDGETYDIAPAVRGFMHYSSETRTDMRASHRLGYRQRESIGQAFWTHELRPGVCFSTRIEAHRAALATLTRND